MNVLITMPLGEFGGGAEQMLYNYLSARTQSTSLRLFLLFLGPGKLADAARELGYPTAVISAGRVRQVHRLIATQRDVGRLMERWRIDRVLAWMPKACAYVTLPARARRVPLFIWRHDIPTSLERFDRWVLRYGRPVSIACSSEAADRALRDCGIAGFSSRAIHPGVAPCLVNVDTAKSIRNKILNNQDGFIVGTVTRLQPWKRVDLFLKAVACLKAQVPTVKALVVGGESHGFSKGHADELKSLGYQLLGDDAIFVGEQRNVGDWLQAMDVFVLASDGEPFGIALVEALAAGKPVVACAGGGPEEIVHTEAVGILLPHSPDPSHMGEAIGKMLASVEAQRARNVNPIYAKRFSPDAMSTSIDSWLSMAL